MALLATALVRLRGAWYLMTGRAKHRAGLTRPCPRDCNQRPVWHDSHLALGALTYLGRKR